MANTLTDKINLILDTKTKIQVAITNSGVAMPPETTFNKYSNYISKISKVSESTDIEDLLVICDLLKEIGVTEYIEHTYTEQEITEVESLIDYILEGGNLDE